MIYLNEALDAGWRLGHIHLCASRLIAAALDRPRGLMDLVMIEA